MAWNDAASARSTSERGVQTWLEGVGLDAIAPRFQALVSKQTATRWTEIQKKQVCFWNLIVMLSWRMHPYSKALGASSTPTQRGDSRKAATDQNRSPPSSGQRLPFEV